MLISSTERTGRVWDNLHRNRAIMHGTLRSEAELRELTELVLQTWDILKFARDSETGGPETRDKIVWFINTIADYVIEGMHHPRVSQSYDQSR